MASRPGVLALRSGVGLQRDRVVAGDRGQPGLQIGDQPAQARGVAGRGERVLTGELRPGDGLHLGGRVELHRARAQRDHAAVQRDVLVGQRAQVAHHLGLGAVPGERRMGQEFRCPRGDLGPRDSRRPAAAAEAPRAPAATCASVVASSQATDTWSASTRQTLMPRSLASACDRGGPAGHLRQHGVEERVVHHVDTGGGQPGRQRAGVAVHPPGDRRSARRRRDSSRTSRPSPPAAPARCRCCRSPCRGGCAVRGSAATAGRPAIRRRPRTPRPAGRAAGGRAWSARPDSRRAGRRIPLAHRSVGRVPNATSAPISPGGVISVSASRSAPTATSAPRSWACSTSFDPVGHPPAGAGQLGDHPEELAVGQARCAGRR